MSSSNRPPLIFYRYEASPFANKLQNVLALKGIPHYRVDVRMTLPRPEISELLGIGYRRIPVLAIGNDIYIDASLTAPVLERLYPPSQGYPSLFPSSKGGGKVDTGLIKAFTAFYTDRVLPHPASNCLPYTTFSKKFIEDRNKWFGKQLDVEGLNSNLPYNHSQLALHMALLEEQLLDGRDWVFDTVTPGYCDLSIYLTFGWAINLKGISDVLSVETFPKSRAWMSRMGTFIKVIREANAPCITSIKGDEAARLIGDSRCVHVEEVELDEAEANRLGLKLGVEVAIAPEDNATNYPTMGKLVGLNHEQVVIELGGSAVPSLRCHFPRLNYSITLKSAALSKL